MTDLSTDAGETNEFISGKNWWVPANARGIIPKEARTNRATHQYNTVQVQGGKEVIPAKELINLAHQNGFVRSELEVLALDLQEQTAVFMATVYFDDGSVYTDIGDASPDNTNSMTASSYPRMAATRAISRALAQALNADTNAAEEIAPSGGGNQRASFRSNTKASGSARKAAPQEDDDDWND